MMTPWRWTWSVGALLLLGWGVSSHALKAAAALPIETQPELSDFMEHRLNPAFTDVSFHLFHQTGGFTPSETSVAALDRLCLEATELAKKPLPDNPASQPFRTYAVNLATACVGLRDSHLTSDREQTEHWYAHVKASCAACHAHYRDGP